MSMTALFKNDRFKQPLLIGALLFAACTIPLFNNLNSIALIILVFACFLQRPLNDSVQKLKNTRLWAFPALYFILLMCSYFWDSSGGFSIKDLERYAALFFLPPAFAVIHHISSRYVRMICFAFVLVTTAVAIICLVRSYFEYQSTGDYRVFYYHYLSQQMRLNAIFLSNYCLASISWMLYYGFMPLGKRSFLIRAILLLNCCFLFLMIFLLSSKLVIFMLIVMLLIFIAYIGYIRKRMLWSALIIAGIILSGAIAVNNLSYLAWRLNVTEIKKYDGEKDNNNGIAIRLLMWKTAIDLIRERPLLGYGIRGARQEVVRKYKEENFVLGYEAGYHSHSQYLETTLMTGIPGLALLLGMIIRLGWKAITRRNFLLMLILAQFICQSVIESDFEVQQELIFFLFFIFLFYYHPSPARVKSVR